MDILRRVDAFLGKFLKISIVLVTTVVVGAMTLQILIRYFLPLPLYGLDEFTGHTAVWLYMLGAAFGAYKSEHIKADLLDVFKVSEQVQKYIHVFGSFLCIIFSCFFIKWTYSYVLWSISKKEVTPSLHIPTVYFQSAILLASVLLLIFFIKELFGNIIRLKNDKVEV